MLDTACNDAAASWRKKRLLLKCATVAAWGEEGEGEGRYCCGSGEILMELLREQTLLRRRESSCGSRHCCGGGENTGKAPAGAVTAAAVKIERELLRGRHCCGSGKNGESSCGSGHYCGSGEKQEVLLREQSLLGQWGNIEKDPAGAGTTAAVGKYREGSC